MDVVHPKGKGKGTGKVNSTFMCLGSYQEVPAKSASVEAALRQILSQAELLLPKMEDVRAEMMGDLVDEEMQQTAKAIEEAAAKIAVCCLIAAR